MGTTCNVEIEVLKADAEVALSAFDREDLVSREELATTVRLRFETVTHAAREEFQRLATAGLTFAGERDDAEPGGSHGQYIACVDGKSQAVTAPGGEIMVRYDYKTLMPLPGETEALERYRDLEAEVMRRFGKEE